MTWQVLPPTHMLDVAGEPENHIFDDSNDCNDCHDEDNEEDEGN